MFLERKLVLKTRGKRVPVLLTFSRPRKVPPDFECACKIKVNGEDYRRFSLFGIDALQALLLSVGLAVTHLEILAKSRNGHFTPESMLGINCVRLPQLRSTSSRKLREVVPRNGPRVSRTATRSRRRR